MSDQAFIIGRFQPLHKGHEDLFEYTIDSYDDVTVILTEGRDVPSDRNPLTLEERETMLQSRYEDEETIHIERLYDDDEALHHGVEPVRDTLATQYEDPDAPVCVTGNPETIDVLAEDYEIEDPPANKFRDEPYRGGYVREQAATDATWRPYVSDDVEALLEEYGFEQRMGELWSTE